MAARLTDVDWSKYFFYDESSATYLRWKVDTYCGKNLNRINRRAGDVAGNSGKGKGLVSLAGKSYLTHRVIWELFNGRIEDATLIVDHINGNDRDNHIANLRLVTPALNAQNVRKRSNSEGVCGVKQARIAWGERVYDYWVASWWEGGKSCRKTFSIANLGFDKARDRATEFRSKTIERLNQEGACYTDRHGK